MKKIILLTLTLSLFAISCTQKSGITGTFTGLTNDTLRIQVNVLNDDNTFEYQRTDIVIVQHNQFTYNPQTNSLTKLVILPRENSNGRFHYNGAAILFYSPGDRISLSANTINNFVTYTASGNRYNEQLSAVNANRQRNNALENKLNFIRENPSEPLSAFLVTLIDENSTMLQYAHRLGNEAKESVFGQMLEQRISRTPAELRRVIGRLNAQKDMKGSLAPDFTLKDINGNYFTLSSLRGKYVMLNFWGSWCRGCFVAFPYIIEYYLTHSDKFEIVGIAFRDEPDLWRSSVEWAGLPWINVIDDNNNSVSTKYHIMAAPTYILIDKEGIIVGFTAGFDEVITYFGEPNISQTFFFHGNSLIF